MYGAVLHDIGGLAQVATVVAFFYWFPARMRLYIVQYVYKPLQLIEWREGMAQTHEFEQKEELVNAITHGIGVGLSLAALVLLVVFASLYGTAWHIVSFSIYGFTMLLLYVCSTLLHSFPKGKVKNLFQIFDHSSIYLFIAGTYTPMLFIIVKGWLGWTLFSVLWAIAAGGVVFKVFYVKEFLLLSTIGYVVMGWLAVFILKPIFHTMPPHGIILLFLGGVLYTLGSIFYVWRKIPYHHAIWHLFVLAGTILHFFMILFYVLPIK
jgi:hemolysin III